MGVNYPFMSVLREILTNFCLGFGMKLLSQHYYVFWPFFTGVLEYLSDGGVAENHKDFKEIHYNDCLTNFNCNSKNGKPDGSITHSFQLKSAYEGNLMPYTNYTYDFKVRRYLGFTILVECDLLRY